MLGRRGGTWGRGMSTGGGRGGGRYRGSSRIAFRTRVNGGLGLGLGSESGLEKIFKESGSGPHQLCVHISSVYLVLLPLVRGGGTIRLPQ